MVTLIHYISDIWIYKATARYTHVYVGYGILLTGGKRFHDYIIVYRGEMGPQN